MGYSQDKILEALNDTGNNQFKVAYQLVVDHQRFLEDSKCLCKRYTYALILSGHINVASKHSTMQSFFASSPPPWNTTFQDDSKADDDDDTVSSIGVLSSSLPTHEDYTQHIGRQEKKEVCFDWRAKVILIWKDDTGHRLERRVAVVVNLLDLLWVLLHREPCCPRLQVIIIISIGLLHPSAAENPTSPDPNGTLVSGVNVLSGKSCWKSTDHCKTLAW